MPEWVGQLVEAALSASGEPEKPAAFEKGEIVRVDNPRFKGRGAFQGWVYTHHTDPFEERPCPCGGSCKRSAAVRLENGNVWWYEEETVHKDGSDRPEPAKPAAQGGKDKVPHGSIRPRPATTSPQDADSEAPVGTVVGATLLHPPVGGEMAQGAVPPTRRGPLPTGPSAETVRAALEVAQARDKWKSAWDAIEDGRPSEGEPWVHLLAEAAVEEREAIIRYRASLPGGAK